MPSIVFPNKLTSLASQRSANLPVLFWWYLSYYKFHAEQHSRWSGLKQQVPKQLWASVHLHMHAHELKIKAKACDVVLSIQICSTGIFIPSFVEIDLRPRVGARVDVQGQSTVPRWKRWPVLDLNVQTAGVHLGETAAIHVPLVWRLHKSSFMYYLRNALRFQVVGTMKTPAYTVLGNWCYEQPWTYSVFQLLGSRRPSILVCSVVFL